MFLRCKFITNCSARVVVNALLIWNGFTANYCIHVLNFGVLFDTAKSPCMYTIVHRTVSKVVG